MKELSFEAIYKQYYRRASLFVKSFVKDDTIVEDIVSESLVYLWKSMQESQVTSPVGLLFITLKNKSLNDLNRQRTRQKAYEKLQQYEVDNLNYKITTLKAQDPSEILLKEVSDIIKETLKKLPPRTSQIFEMNRYEELTAREIAEKLGITQKGVEYHISIALKELRNTLKDYLPFYLLLIQEI